MYETSGVVSRVYYSLATLAQHLFSSDAMFSRDATEQTGNKIVNQLGTMWYSAGDKPDQLLVAKRQQIKTRRPLSITRKNVLSGLTS